jgi:hypothetical protein
MGYTVRDLQARVNALLFEWHPKGALVVDGMNGPNTRAWVSQAMELRKVKRPHLLFDQSGLHGIIWHWAASSYTVTDKVLSHYNDGHDHLGNSYDGGARAEHQANYDWRKGVGVSHSRNANTGRIGQAVIAMGNAEGWPLDVGQYPMTWAGIDAMLMRGVDYHYQFDIPITPWSMLTHAEIQPTLGITQNGKWDIRWLPEDAKVTDAREAGDILRARMRGML